MQSVLEYLSTPAGAMSILLAQAKQRLVQCEVEDCRIKQQFRLMIAPRLRQGNQRLETAALYPLQVNLESGGRVNHMAIWAEALELWRRNPRLEWFFIQVADERRVQMGFPPTVEPSPEWTNGYPRQFCSGKDSRRVYSEEELIEETASLATRPLLRKWLVIQKRMDAALDRHGTNLSASALDELRGHLIDKIAQYCWLRRGPLRKLRLPLEGELSRWACDYRRNILFAGQTISQTYSLNRLVGEEVGTEFLDLLADPQAQEEATGVAIPATLLVVISLLRKQLENFNAPFFREVVTDLLAGNFAVADDGTVRADEGVFERYCAKRTSWSAKLYFHLRGVNGNSREASFARHAFDQLVKTLPRFLFTCADRSLVIRLLERAWDMPNLCYGEVVHQVMTYARKRVKSWEALPAQRRTSLQAKDQAKLIAQCSTLDPAWEYYGGTLGTLWRAYGELLAHQCFEILREARFRCFSQTFQSLSDRLFRLRKQVEEYKPDFEKWLECSRGRFQQS
jgi:hypothetical protein